MKDGWLETRVFNTSPTFQTVELVRIVFDDAEQARPTDPGIGMTVYPSMGSVENGVFTPIPEPSGLALLALGAGGLAARRRRKKVAS